MVGQAPPYKLKLSVNGYIAILTKPCTALRRLAVQKRTVFGGAPCTELCEYRYKKKAPAMQGLLSCAKKAGLATGKQIQECSKGKRYKENQGRRWSSEPSLMLSKRKVDI